MRGEFVGFAVATLAALVSDVRDQELWLAFVGPSLCDNFGKLPRDHGSCVSRAPASDNSCRKLHPLFSPARDNSSTMRYVGDGLAVGLVAVVVVVWLVLFVMHLRHSSVGGLRTVLGFDLWTELLRRRPKM